MPRASVDTTQLDDDKMRRCTSTVPSSGMREPVIRRTVVVLPQPEGPSNVTNELSLSSRLTSETAATSAFAPKFFDNPRIVIPAITLPYQLLTGAASREETERPPIRYASQIAAPMIAMLTIASAATGSM